MKRQGILLLSILGISILSLVVWELEYQHVSLVLWLLVILGVLWCCAEVAVSLRPSSSTRRERIRTINRSRPSRNRWLLTLVGAIVLAGLGILFWLLGFETTGQLLWFLVVVALLWGCAQVSFLLRPDRAGRRADEESISASRTSRRTLLDQFLPGASMRSGIYNKRNEEVWDSNENLPPHTSY
jgi:hypothetical protein